MQNVCLFLHCSRGLLDSCNQFVRLFVRSFVPSFIPSFISSIDVFRCSDCGCLLKSWYCQRNGKLFCKEHYRKRFNEACNHCAICITGPVMVSHTYAYHYYEY